MKITKLLLPSALMLMSSIVSAATLYSLPFKGEDFADTEKVFATDHSQSTAQRYAYDFSGRRYDAGEKKWLSTVGSTANFNSNPTNSKSVIYNRPVYAMRSGTIVACWRNAPENPRPKISGDTTSGRQWLHESFKAGLMPGGGNILWVEHDDGTMMLYAHMVPGSISADLCPKNDALYSRRLRAGESEFDVTFAGLRLSDQVRVVEGQLLGRVGNSGNSTGPHLHAHLERMGVGEVIKFKSGLAAPVDNTSQYGNWSRFANKQIPNGNTLIWPSRTVTGFYSRHALQSAAFQSIFDHLVDSGFKPKLLDGYSVKGNTFYNMIWTPANVSWKAFAGLTSSRYQSRFTEAVRDGYVPVYVDSFTNAHGQRFSVVFEKRALAYLARHNISAQEHDAVLKQAQSLGLKPQSVSVVSVNGERRYTDLYTGDDIGSWVMRSQISESDYQSVYDQQLKAGRRPAYLSAYTLEGNVFYSAVFASRPSTAARARHGISSSQYQTLANQYISQGFKPVALTAINDHDTHRFATVWRK